MLRRLGLLLFTAIFVTGGWGQAQQPGGRAEAARRAGLPVQDQHVQLSGWAMILCALALQAAPLRRPAALTLALILSPITYAGHRFWEMEPGQARQGQRVHFMKNLSLIGGALYIAGTSK
jgi:putative oxidoreductase